jgi:hypothetical protein
MRGGVMALRTDFSEIVSTLIAFIRDNELELVGEMLEQNPGLLLQKGSVEINNRSEIEQLRIFPPSRMVGGQQIFDSAVAPKPFIRDIYPLNVAFGMGHVAMCELLLKHMDKSIALAQLQEEFPEGLGFDPLQDARRVAYNESGKSKIFEQLAFLRAMQSPNSDSYLLSYSGEAEKLVAEIKEWQAEMMTAKQEEEIRRTQKPAAPVAVEREIKAGNMDPDLQAKEKEEAEKKAQAEAIAAAAKADAIEQEIIRMAAAKFDAEDATRTKEIARLLELKEESTTKHERTVAESQQLLERDNNQLFQIQFGPIDAQITTEIGKVRARTWIYEATRQAKTDALTYLKDLLVPNKLNELKQFISALKYLSVNFHANGRTYYPALAMSARVYKKSGTAKIVENLEGSIAYFESRLNIKAQEHHQQSIRRAQFYTRELEALDSHLAALQREAEESTLEHHIAVVRAQFERCDAPKPAEVAPRSRAPEPNRIPRLLRLDASDVAPPPYAAHAPRQQGIFAVPAPAPSQPQPAVFANPFQVTYERK